MNRKMMSICMTAILFIAFSAVPMTSVLNDATLYEENRDDTLVDYEQYFVDSIINSVGMEKYQNLSTDELALLYLLSYQEYMSSKHVNADDYVDIYVDKVTDYIDGTLMIPEVFSVFNDTEVAIKIDSSKGGVTKFESYDWGYRLYLSSADMNAILGSGLSGAGLVTYFVSLGLGVAAAMFFAGVALALIGSYYDYDGIIIEVRLGVLVDVLGFTILIPYAQPKISVYPQ